MKMTVMQATQILKRHNKWRSGVSIKMIDPTRLGMAIESAPKDGSQIYVDAPELDCGCSIAYFDDGAWRSAWDGRVFVDYAPTHWQPLPAPPKQGDE